MSIEALILGKLHEPAKSRQSDRTGRPFVTAKVLAAAGDGNSVFINVVAFSESAGQILMSLDAGDSVALAGTLKPGAWIDREGNARPALDLVAAQVMTTYGLKKKRDAVAGAANSDLKSKLEGQTSNPTHAADGQTSNPTKYESFVHDDDAWLRGGA